MWCVLVTGFEGYTSKQRARGRYRVRVTARLARRESRFTKWQARPHAQERRSRSSNKEPTKEWPITLDSPKQHDKALAWRRLFSQPLARPLSTPGLNLLGLEAQPHQPIQQHVSTVDSTPLCDTCHSRQSTDRSRTLCPAWQILLSCALHRQPPLPLSRGSSPCSRRVVMRLRSLFLLKHRQFAALHRVFAREPVAQGSKQRPHELFATLLGKSACGLASSRIFTVEGDASHHI